MMPKSEMIHEAQNFADIATAPGDLPMPEIQRRNALQRRQFRHDNTIDPLAPAPDTPVTVCAQNGGDLPLERAEVWYTTDGSVPDVGAHVVPMEIEGADWDPLPGYLTRWEATIPAQPAGTVVRYRVAGWRAGEEGDAPDLFAQDGQGLWFRYHDGAGVDTFGYRVEERGPVHPQWLQDAVIYQIFLDRYHPGTPDGEFDHDGSPRGKHGGTLRGVQQALPYLSKLGVTCLWLSPICASQSFHRYDAIDFFTVDPVLGTKEDLRALTNAAHNLNMRVILDFVPSHCSWKHPAFQDALHDPDAPTHDWFVFTDWPDEYRSFLERVPSLPSFNTNSAGARRHIIDSAIQWVREYGIDGFRLDHVIGHGMDFWTQFRDELVAVKPDVVTIGEATDTADALRRYRGKLTDVLDFPLARALRLTFGTGDWSLAQLDTFLTTYDLYMQEGPGRVSFLDNHDMDRFLFLAGDDTSRLKLAALCQFALTQPPVIYYGTEIGMSQEHGTDEVGFGGDAEARRDMLWNPDEWNEEVLAFYRTLIGVRRSEPALRYGSRRRVHLDVERGTYTFVRDVEDSRGVIAAFNVNDTPQTISLPAGVNEILLDTTDGVELDAQTVVLPAQAGALLT